MEGTVFLLRENRKWKVSWRMNQLHNRTSENSHTNAQKSGPATSHRLSIYIINYNCIIVNGFAWLIVKIQIRDPYVDALICRYVLCTVGKYLIHHACMITDSLTGSKSLVRKKKALTLWWIELWGPEVTFFSFADNIREEVKLTPALSRLTFLARVWAWDFKTDIQHEVCRDKLYFLMLWWATIHRGENSSVIKRRLNHRDPPGDWFFSYLSRVIFFHSHQVFQDKHGCFDTPLLVFFIMMVLCTTQRNPLSNMLDVICRCISRLFVCVKLK